jgi:triacylglycerol lipase
MSDRASERPLVVLLHGLARTSASMRHMSAALQAAGFETWSCTYPSRRSSIADAAREVVDRLRREAAGRPLLAVTHSMGGILVRHMHHPDLDWRRIVMLAPPNQGSQLAALLKESALFRWFYGPAGRELASAAAWPEPPAPFLVIAGTKGRAIINPTSWTVARMFEPSEPHDGTVRVAETKLQGMAAFETVDATHTSIMNDREAQALALRFLRGGDVS